MKKLALRCLLILICLMPIRAVVQARSGPTPVYSLVYPTRAWSGTGGVNIVTLYDDSSHYLEKVAHAYYAQGDMYLVKPWWSADGRTVYLPINTGGTDKILVTQIDAYEVTTHTTRKLAELETYNEAYEVISLESVSPDGRYVWVNTMMDSRLLDLTTGKWLAHTNCPSDVIGWLENRSVLFEVMGCDPHFLVFDAPTGQLIRTVPLDDGKYGYAYEWHTVDIDPPYLVGISLDTTSPSLRLDIDAGTLTPLATDIAATPTPTPNIVFPADCGDGCNIAYAPNNRTLVVLRSTAMPQSVELYNASGRVWSGKYEPVTPIEWPGNVDWSANGSWLFLNGMGVAVDVAAGQTVQVPGVHRFINTSPDERWWVVNSLDPSESPKTRATLYDSQTGKQLVLLQSDILPEGDFHWAPASFYLWSPVVH